MTTRAVVMGAAAVALLIVHPARGAETATEKTGDLWQITHAMSMAVPGGMSLPSQTTTVCRPKSEANMPPKMGKDDCTTDSMDRKGNRVDWKVSCKDGSTGTGHVEYDRPDHYTGALALSTQNGEMQMKFEGNRLRDCDPNDSNDPQNRGNQIRAQIAAAQAQSAAAEAQSAAMMAKRCSDAAAEADSMLFLGPMAQCKDPQHLKAFCASLSTQAGFEKLAGIPPGAGYGLAESAAACGTDSEKLRQNLCAGAAASASYAFLAGHCPPEAKALAQKECAGRKYTSIADPNLRGFCGTYAQQLLSEDADKKDANEKDEPTDPKKETEKKTKKLLKGLFGK